MSAHVLLNLLNELRKRDKMTGMRIILSVFRNKFNKFNNTGARMLNRFYLSHYIILLKNCIFGFETSKICTFTQHYNRRHYLMFLNQQTTSG